MSTEPEVKEGVLDALVEALKGNFATKDEKARRMAICKAPCEHLSGTGEQCNKCHCLIRIKTGLVNHHCPISKW